ncbi:Ribosome maturation factor RimM [Carnimonas sp. R-84865]
MSIDRNAAEQSNDQRVVMGSLTSPYGIKGWLKVYSHTSPMEGILDYPHWSVEKNGVERRFRVLQGRRQGKGLVVQLEGVDSRDAAEALGGATIRLAAGELPRLSEGEFYWYQLEGLAVATTDGVALGRVAYLFETGANDVLVIKGAEDGKERLVPFIPDDVIIDIDLDAGHMTVDWDPDF